MHDKKFLTLTEQIEYLNVEKKIACVEEDKISLLRIGYFNLINGYKTPFTSSRDALGNHIYSKGTTINQIIELKRFDDNLRHLLLKTITRFEEEIRTITSYILEKDKKNNVTWRSVRAYNPDKSSTEIQKLISKIQNEVKDREYLEYVSFYKQNHNRIPMWIVTKIVFLGTFINLIEYSNPSVKNTLCEIYNLKDSSGKNYDKLLFGSLHWIRIVRNACAHNERIYCLKGEGRINDNEILKFGNRYKKIRERRLFDLFIYFKYFLEPSEYRNFISEIKGMLVDLQNKVTPFAFDNIRAGMGIKSLSDLDILVKDVQDNNYVILLNDKAEKI